MESGRVWSVGTHAELLTRGRGLRAVGGRSTSDFPATAPRAYSASSRALSSLPLRTEAAVARRLAWISDTL